MMYDQDRSATSSDQFGIAQERTGVDDNRPVVARHLDVLAKVVEAVEHEVTDLIARLEPVLSPDEPRPENGADAEAKKAVRHQSHMADRIEDTVGRLTRLATQVSRVRSRVEV